MALKTNSKKARENIRVYIMKYSNVAQNPDEYDFTGDASKFEDVAGYMYECFRRQKADDAFYRNWPEQKVFADWAAGLPFGDMFCYFNNRSAVDDCAIILEGDDDYIKKYRRDGWDDKTVEWNYERESEAEQFLTGLIYREIIAVVK